MTTPTAIHTFRMTEAKAELVHKVVASHIEALKNWIISAVEHDDIDRALPMIAELNEYKTLFAAFNMQAKHTIANSTGSPLELKHTVNDR